MEAGFPPGTKPAAMVRASSPKIGNRDPWPQLRAGGAQRSAETLTDKKGSATRAKPERIPGWGSNGLPGLQPHLSSLKEPTDDQNGPVSRFKVVSRELLFYEPLAGDAFRRSG
jgi:hypothetical protein